MIPEIECWQRGKKQNRKLKKKLVAKRWVSKGVLAVAIGAVLTCSPLTAKADAHQSRGVNVVVNTTNGPFTAGDPGNCDPTTFTPKPGDPACTGTLGQMFTASGDFTGTLLIEETFVAFADGSSSFIDFEIWTGTFAGHGTGSFILLEYDGTGRPSGVNTSRLRIVDGTGTGGLEGITGTGSFSNASGEDVTKLTLHFME